MIPAFPEFKIVEVGDREAVESHTHRYPPYSDFNFTSLWAWDTSNERMISELNGNLVVHFTDYATNEPFLSFLGTNKTHENRFASRAERRFSLYAYVDWHNHERKHGTPGMTPTGKLAQYAKRLESADNAV